MLPIIVYVCCCRSVVATMFGE